MTKNKKIILSITLIIFSFSLFKIVSAVEFVPQVTIPNSEFTAGQAVQLEYGLRPIGNYIKAIYNYALIIVGILAAIVLIIGGIIWLTSAGNSERVTQAKSWIAGALTGLILMFLSYTILKTINPQLVSLRVPGIQTIGNVNKGCCKLQKNEIINPYLLPGNTNNVVKLTFNATSLECYNRALAIEELYIQPLEELSEEDRNDIEGYMKRHNKFFPNSIATGFNSCTKTGVYLSSYTSKAFLCVNTIKPKESYDNHDQTSKIFQFFEEGLNCESLSIPDIKEIVNRKYPSYEISPDIEMIVKYVCEKENNSCVNSYNGIETSNPFVKWCYNNLCWPHKGNLGEPCGNDGSLCLPTGYSCSKIPGFTERDNSGGRDCGDDVKCCIKNKTYWRELGY